MANLQNIAPSEFLEKVFTNVNYWLDFAERKNAYLFSFFSLSSVASVIVENFTKPTHLIKFSLAAFLLLFIISVITALIALYPKTRISAFFLKNGKNEKILEADSLLFYEHISKYSVEEYREKLKSKYNIEITDDDGYSLDLIGQITINSDIAKKKFKCFKFSCFLVFIALSQFSIALGISLFAEGV